MSGKSRLDRLELIPNEKERSEPLFKTQQEYEQFCIDFQNAVEPDLKKLAEARAKSEEYARHHYIRSYRFPSRTNYKLRN